MKVAVQFGSVCFSRDCIVHPTSFINSQYKEEEYLLCHVNKTEAGKTKGLSAGNSEQAFIHI